MRSLRRLLNAVAIIGVILAPSVSIAGDEAAPPPPDWVTLYRSGRFIDSLKLLEDQVGAAAGEQKKLQALESLLDICASHYVYQCLQAHGSEYLNLVQKLNSKDAEKLKASLFYFTERFIENDYGSIEKLGGFDFADRAARPLADPITAVNLYLLYARIRQSRGEFQLASDEISRALAATLMIDPRNRYGIATSLAQIVEILNSNLDTLGATKILAVAKDFILSNLSPHGVDRTVFLIDLINTFSYRGFTPEYLALLQSDRDAVKQLQIEPWRREYWLSMLNRSSAVLAALGRYDEAKAMIHEHPIAARRATILAKGQFETIQELGYALVEMYVEYCAGGDVDPAWLPLFQKETARKESFFLVREQEAAYRHFSLSMLFAKTSKDEARHELREAVKAELAIFEESMSRVDRRFLLPRFEDSILFTMFVMTPPETEEDKDLVLRSMEYVNRTPQFALADTLASLAKTSDDETRRLIHSGQRLDDEQSKWELGKLRELIAKAAAGNNGPLDKESFKRSVATMQTMESFVHLRQYVAERTGASGAREAKGHLAGFRELIDALRPGEAFVEYTNGMGHLLRVCVRDGKMWNAKAQIDGGILEDIKLIDQALSPERELSLVEDAQYPVESAVRIYHALFDGLEECVPKGTHIIFRGPSNLASISLAALLIEVPPKIREGYDFQTAHWFFRDHPVSYVVSEQAFVAARKIASSAGGDRSFLGVGDPRLKAPVVAPPAETEYVAMRNGRPGVRVSMLDELPDTKVELEAISKGMQSADLLLGADATKERLLSLPLERYDEIDFATHGLVRNDLPGLGDAALVLTPGGDDPNSAILTGREIASLTLKARLAVLSACNTAFSDPNIFGGQVQGLSMAFAVAGTPTSIASLRPVESATSRRIMTTFHARLHGADTPTIAQAFSDGMEDALLHAPSPEFRHPRFWSQFVVLGDGGVRFKRASNVASNVGSITEVSETGGEILHSVAFQQDVITSEIGPRYGIRHASLIRRRSPDGIVKWSVEDRVTSVGNLAVVGERIFAIGSRWDGAAHPILRVISPDGKIESQTELDNPYDSSGIIGLLAAPGGGALLVTNPFVYSDQDKSFTIHRLNASGQEVARQKLEVPDLVPGAIVMGATAVDRKFLYLAANLGRKFVGQTRFDDFGLLRTCYDSPGSHIFRIDPDTLKTVSDQILPNMAIRQLEMDGDGLLISGSAYPDCRWGARAYAARLDGRMNLIDIWHDDSPFDSAAYTVKHEGSGWKVIGTVARAVTVEEPPDPSVIAPDLKAAEGRNRHPSEAFTAHITPSGPTTKEFLSTGLPLNLTGTVEHGGRNLLYGSAGFNPWWGWMN